MSVVVGMFLLLLVVQLLEFVVVVVHGGPSVVHGVASIIPDLNPGRPRPALGHSDLLPLCP